MKKVLLTGASGFVGQALLRRLKNDGYEVRPAARRPRDSGWVELDLSGMRGAFKSALANVDVVVHTAGRAHVMKDKVADSLAEFRRVNTEGTTNLAREAATGGVSRFVYVSSIKVNGEFTRPGRPFSADDTPAPIDPYAVSKYEAEEALKQVASETEMEFVIVRPPLVYGPGVKANFLSMMCWLQKGIPLPLGAISNKRSLVALDNLVDLIVTCIGHPAAPRQTFLAGDGEYLSTT
jgi:nucleoside-diphosphate-sugar epimerase